MIITCAISILLLMLSAWAVGWFALNLITYWLQNNERWLKNGGKHKEKRK